jgi:hypothetical protein
VPQALGDRQRQARLANPTGACEGDQSSLRDHTPELFDLLVAADDRRQRCRQVPDRARTVHLGWHGGGQVTGVAEECLMQSCQLSPR